jgi:hypothetical protein
MIGDGVPWKEELLRVAETLKGRVQQQRWMDRTNFLVERDVMIAGYAIRKLHESHKLSDELVATPITVFRHPLIGKRVDVYDRHEFYEHYDMEAPEEVELSLTEFCNQLIHSWVFMLSSTETRPYRFNGIYVSSDWATKKWVYFLPAQVLTDFFRAVGLDDVWVVEMRRDSSGVMHVVRVSSEPPTDPEGSTSGLASTN